ncbi:hypothetical protein SORBI_3002G190600 [Sorghum bicolor]|uniref:Uncharacterized protein n=1 Tax=Sorghum bicolor TaxID=4558 RepID=A0A1B6QC98_SORBI|nr:hypothetical protein SORBI_3002G190600 [Sorghum bicolor]
MMQIVRVQHQSIYCVPSICRELLGGNGWVTKSVMSYRNQKRTRGGDGLHHSTQPLRKKMAVKSMERIVEGLAKLHS